MGPITQLATYAATRITGGRLDNPPMWLRMLLGGSAMTDSGINVTEDTALTYSAVWAAVNILAGGVGVLPQIVYQRIEPRGKTRDKTHPAYALLHDRANPYMDAQVFRETVQAHVCLWGNGYAEIERDGAGRPLNLWPLLPNRVAVKIAPNGALYYEVTLKEGGIVPLEAENVLHIRGLGFDGYQGYSVIGYHRESIGLGLATQKFGAKFFGNGAKPGGVLKHPGKISEQAAKNLKASWNEIHQGLDNAHRIALLEEGMEWQEIGMPLEDAQFIETQKFGLSNIARIFQVPPHMLADLDKATFSNIEHQGIEFVTWSLTRWLKKWEHEANAKLLMPSEQQSHFTEFLIDAYLRGDMKSRYQGYEIGRRNGWLSKNDVRGMENLNPIEGGDDYTSLAELQASKNMKIDGGLGTDSKDPDDPPENRVHVQRQRIAAAFQPVLADVVGRMARKECNDARRARNKEADQLDAWSDQYYRDYLPTFRSAIIPVIDGSAEAIWATCSPLPLDAAALAKIATFTAEAAQRHCDAARAAIVAKEELTETASPAESAALIDGLVSLLEAHEKGIRHGTETDHSAVSV